VPLPDDGCKVNLVPPTRATLKALRRTSSSVTEDNSSSLTGGAPTYTSSSSSSALPTSTVLSTAVTARKTALKRQYTSTADVVPKGELVSFGELKEIN
jgi:hypothetical protein